MYRSRTEENGLRSREIESNRVAVFVVKAMKGSRIVKDHHHTIKLNFAKEMVKAMTQGHVEAVGGTRPAHAGVRGVTNIPLLEALEQMPYYVKFMKYILSKKKRLGEFETVELTKECIAFL
ncbi:retrotransposon gag protein [Gossypium australe]|uniref:Retrotransposon gag protein n=1 Tax=Gossypium australe TaxID=47621 RepID=A0A5B6VCX0_9ROSI|nr:retrotransposon gag protein [Gossypium australe]